MLGDILYYLCWVIVAYLGWYHYLRPRVDAEKYFKNKRIVITGASSGIGEYLAYALSRMNTQLVLSARRKEQLDVVAQRCRENGSSAAVVVADASKPEDCQRLIRESVRALGGQLDMVILNAGVSMVKTLEEVDDPATLYRQLMETNYIGPVVTTKAALPELEKTNGTLAVVSSLAAFFSPPFRSGYAPTKAALNAFLDSLYNERADLPPSRRVHLCKIYPPFVRTDIRQSSLGGVTRQFREDKMMSVEHCVDLMIQGLAEERREIWFKPFYRFGAILRAIIPDGAAWYVRRIVRNLLVQ